MDAPDRVMTRFHFSLPNDYMQFWNAGLLVNDHTKGIRVSRHSWLSPDEIADCPLPAYKMKSLIPCAQTPGRDHYCWQVTESVDAWIAECPRDSDFAEGFAPHFEGFVFRSLLDEFADSWWIEDQSLIAAIFREYATRVSSILRPSWAEAILKCAAGTPMLNRWNRLGVISEEQASTIIRYELAFPMFGRGFRQHAG